MKIVRHDRHGRPEYAPLTQGNAALKDAAILQAACERAELKDRQDANQLNPHERLLRSIFGDIKK